MKEKEVKEQIKFMLKLSGLNNDKKFINYVYDKHLNEFSIAIIKKLHEEFKENLV